MTESTFERYHWDCDICPLNPCPSKGCMLTEDCYDDMVIYCKKNGLKLEQVFMDCMSKRNNLCVFYID